jgi:lipopolysaccharide export system protein LptA
MKKFRALALSCAVALPALLRGADPVPDQSTELVCDHMEMWSVNEETHAICTGSVVLTGTDMKISCDRLEIIAEGIADKAATIPVLERFKYLLATSHVRIVQGDREATCGRAEVLPREDKVILTEDPVVIDHTASSVTHGTKITMLRGERRVLVENPHATMPSIKDLGFDRNKPVTPADGAAKP